MPSFLQSSGRSRWPLAAAILPLLTHVGLLWTYDLAARPVTTLLLLGLGLAGLIPATRLLTAIPKSAGAVILSVAFLLRLLLWPLPPTLSEDVYRYVWDGRVAGAGLNPYRYPPAAPELTPLRDELWDRLAHREVPTVYPPLALAAFSIAARFGSPVAALKGLLALVDLGGCAVLLGLARRLGVPRARVVWYAWNPLVTLETAGMGHVDALGVSAVLVATSLVLGRRGGACSAGLAAAAAVLAKLVPIVALPVWVRHARRPVALILMCGLVLIAALAPVAIATGGVPPGLVTYGVSWEFNGPLYEPLWRALDRLNAPAAVASLLDGLKARGGQSQIWNRLYPLNYPQFLAKVLLATGLLVLLFWAWRRTSLVPGLGWTFSFVVLFSATVYPWYLLWVLPWAALCRQTAWLALSGLILLSYLDQMTAVALFPWIWLAIWGPFCLLLVRSPRWSIG